MNSITKSIFTHRNLTFMIVSFTVQHTVHSIYNWSTKYGFCYIYTTTVVVVWLYYNSQSIGCTQRNIERLYSTRHNKLDIDYGIDLNLPTPLPIDLYLGWNWQPPSGQQTYHSNRHQLWCHVLVAMADVTSCYGNDFSDFNCRVRTVWSDDFTVWKDDKSGKYGQFEHVTCSCRHILVHNIKYFEKNK